MFIHLFRWRTFGTLSSFQVTNMKIKRLTKRRCEVEVQYANVCWCGTHGHLSTNLSKHTETSWLHWHKINRSWFWPWYTFENISGFCDPRIDTADSHPVFCERRSNWIIFVKRIWHLDILVVLMSISLLILYLFSCFLSFSSIICSSKLILLLFLLFLINRKIINGTLAPL